MAAASATAPTTKYPLLNALICADTPVEGDGEEIFCGAGADDDWMQQSAEGHANGPKVGSRPPPPIMVWSYWSLAPAPAPPPIWYG